MKTPAINLRPGNANSAATERKQEKGNTQAWKWIRLTDLAETRSGATPPRGTSHYYGGSIPWVKTGELRDNLIESSDEYVTDAAVRETSLKLLPKGTVLIACMAKARHGEELASLPVRQQRTRRASRFFPTTDLTRLSCNFGFGRVIVASDR